jgi:arrestin-2
MFRSQLLMTYKYGREEDEVMGVKFSKVLVLCHQQIYPLPMTKEKLEITPMQESLVRKLGANAHPFILKFPINAPNSVILHTADNKGGLFFF